ncbi:hypothetical protein [Amycolatopsis balhimycina]|uniref:hypothetical protein n=1 Tax=Amycolatopsis balhimycina TaxID=208443 RepID=UPI000F78C72A|nr:hypothetical protein [Amycolatopsis balhimycina]
MLLLVFGSPCSAAATPVQKGVAPAPAEAAGVGREAANEGFDWDLTVARKGQFLQKLVLRSLFCSNLLLAEQQSL